VKEKNTPANVLTLEKKHISDTATVTNETAIVAIGFLWKIVRILYLSLIKGM